MNKTKKYKANITTTIVILFISLIAFCACGIDAAHVIVSRYKLQKITETIALVMASKLKAQEPYHKSKEELDLTAYNFEKLYSKQAGGFWNFEVKEISYKEISSDDVRVKISANADIPTYFLKFTGIGKITLYAVSYAKATSKSYEAEPFNTNNETTVTFDDIVTDKTGDDIKINYDGDYFAFIGLKDSDDNIVWSDLGRKTKSATSNIEIANGQTMRCIKGSETFDLSYMKDDDNDTIGLVKYLRIYKANCDGNNPEENNSFTPPVIDILNNVSLINRTVY